MTDPQTPATEAGRRLLEETAGFDGDGLAPIDRPTWLADILAIEAEARAEAIARVLTEVVRAAVLAILDPQP